MVKVFRFVWMFVLFLELELVMVRVEMGVDGFMC